MGLRDRARRLGVVSGRIAQVGSWTVVRLRWLLVAVWIAAAVAATLFLPAPGQQSADILGTLIPRDAPSIQTEFRSLRDFKIPLLARVAVVVRDPHGLSPEDQIAIVRKALVADQHRSVQGIGGALPVTNAVGLIPGNPERNTTAITYLFFYPQLSFGAQTYLAQQYARTTPRPKTAFSGYTGSIPARVRQGQFINEALPRIEIATLLLIGVLLGLSFRSVLVPVVTLATAGVAFLTGIHVATWFGNRFGFFIPPELEPVIVVLILGIVTDYSIFFLFGFRDRLRAGQSRLAAAEATTADFLPIIVTAGLTVAAGTASLLAGTLQFIRSFGPALAITVLVSLIVAVTSLPALLAIIGRALYWPHRPPAPVADPETGRSVGAEPQMMRDSAVAGTGFRDRLARFTTAKPVAAFVALVVVVGLGIAAWQLKEARLGFSEITGLPNGYTVKVAEQQAAAGFSAGMVAPTEILLEGTGLDTKVPQLTKLETLFRREDGVATVLGPAEQSQAGTLLDLLQARAGSNPSGQPVPVQPGQLPTSKELQQLGLMVTPSGTAARYLVILDHEPYGAGAISDINRLEHDLPSLLRQAGLTGVRVGFAGDSAIARDTVARVIDDLARIAIAIALIDLVLLILFLRSLVAPLFLLAASFLALGATLGLTTWVFMGVFGHDHLTYYVPFAAAVLLVSLGSDYNIFIVGRMWEEARRRPLREAVAVGARRATRPITLAGIILASSFALLGIVPLWPFREFAFAMVVGILLDSFVVRPFLVPALITLFGRVSFWPWGARLQAHESPTGQTQTVVPEEEDEGMGPAARTAS
jgi:RND superfamily putative drug exporter